MWNQAIIYLLCTVYKLFATGILRVDASCRKPQRIRRDFLRVVSLRVWRPEVTMIPSCSAWRWRVFWTEASLRSVDLKEKLFPGLKRSQLILVQPLHFSQYLHTHVFFVLMRFEAGEVSYWSHECCPLMCDTRHSNIIL